MLVQLAGGWQRDKNTVLLPASGFRLKIKVYYKKVSGFDKYPTYGLYLGFW